MCGRFHQHKPRELIELMFEVGRVLEAGDVAYRPRYNIAPTDRVPIVRLGDDGVRELLPSAWGFPWIKGTTINARAETVASSPAFRGQFRSKRAIIPASGYFEWLPGTDGKKQPYSIQRADGQPLGLAGLWSPGEDGAHFTILTCPAQGLAARLHQRMPVMLPPETFAEWLDVQNPNAVDLTMPGALPALDAFPVDRRVGNVRWDEPTLVQPQGPGLQQLSLGLG